MKIVTIVGARPQFIKSAIVSKAFQKKYNDNFKETIVHTGQHYDHNMSDIFFTELEIKKPDYNLGIGSDNHGRQTAKMLDGIEEILLKESPDIVMVYGDTNSTLAGSLAAGKLNIPVAHVEAGVRTFNKNMPEELNRLLTDHLAELLFVPTLISKNNLLREGINKNNIFLVGDVMYDAVLFYGDKAEKRSNILNTLKLKPRSYILTTIHRAENTNSFERIKAIFEGLNMVGDELDVVIPIHPRTDQYLKKNFNALYAEKFHNIKFIEPVGYVDMLMLEKNAKLIATDSGGVQKEAYFSKVPCVLLRMDNELSWLELSEVGSNELVEPSDSNNIKDKILNRLKEGNKNINYNVIEELFGDGHASEKICNVITDYLCKE